MTKETPAKVVWHDACGGKTGWLGHQEATDYKPYVVESYGWLLRSDRKVVTIAVSRHQHRNGAYSYADTLDVPRAMVKSITKFRR